MSRALRRCGAAAGVGGALALLAAGASAHAQVFRSQTETVRVEVLVTDHGTAVKGLAAGDFEVLDNGTPQRVELISHDPLPVTLVLVLDGSESVEGTRLSNLVDASRALVDALEQRDSVSLLTFNHALALQVTGARDAGDVRKALAAMKGKGLTALRDAAYAGMVLGENASGRAMLVIFSDGLDTSSWLTQGQVLQSARATDVLTYAVVLGARQPSFLRDLTSTTGGTVFHAGSDADLGPTFLRVLDDFRNRYVIGYRPAGVAADGWHALRVRVKGRRYSVTARPGYIRRPDTGR